jgi:two-component system CheB/CheR fusion protein
VVKDSSDAITVQDFKGNIIEWNKGAEKMYGYSEDEALKMNIIDTIPKDRRKEALAFLEKVQKQDIESFETQRLTKDGRTLDVWMTVTRMVDNHGKPTAIATTERDITGYKCQEISGDKT